MLVQKLAINLGRIILVGFSNYKQFVGYYIFYRNTNITSASGTKLELEGKLTGKVHVSISVQKRFKVMLTENYINMKYM